MAPRIQDARQRRFGQHGPLPRRKQNVAAALDPGLFASLQSHLALIGKTTSHYIADLIAADLATHHNALPDNDDCPF